MCNPSQLLTACRPTASYAVPSLVHACHRACWAGCATKSSHGRHQRSLVPPHQDSATMTSDHVDWLRNRFVALSEHTKEFYHKDSQAPCIIKFHI